MSFSNKYSLVGKKATTKKLDRSMSKEEMMSLPMTVLDGRFTHATYRVIFAGCGKLEEVAEMYKSFPGKIVPTIQDCLNFDISREGLERSISWSQNVVTLYLKKSEASSKLHDIRAQLMSLGFTEDDGALIYFGTPKYYIDQVIAKLGISSEEAKKLVQNSYEMGWIKII